MKRARPWMIAVVLVASVLTATLLFAPSLDGPPPLDKPKGETHREAGQTSAPLSSTEPKRHFRTAESIKSQASPSQSAVERAADRFARRMYGEEIAAALRLPPDLAWYTLTGDSNIAKVEAVQALAYLATECAEYKLISPAFDAEAFARELTIDLPSNNVREVQLSLQQEVRSARSRKVACERASITFDDLAELLRLRGPSSREAIAALLVPGDRPPDSTLLRTLLKPGVPGDFGVLAAEKLIDSPLEQDRVAALHFLNAAADSNPHAALLLARCATTGCGATTPDESAQGGWLELAARGGSLEALDAKVSFHARRGESRDALAWVDFALWLARRGCNDGSPLGASARLADLLATRRRLSEEISAADRASSDGVSSLIDQFGPQASRNFGCDGD